MLQELYELSYNFTKKRNRSYYRYFLHKHKLGSRFSIICGQRGVGKTTAMVQHLLSLVDGQPDSNNILYVQADHFVVAKHSLYEISEAFATRGGKAICFDEIHKYPNWSQELKSIFDSFDQLRILASGSSALEIHKGSHDLSRRALRYNMFGMSFREYIELSQKMTLPTLSFEQILQDHRSHAARLVQAVEAKEERILALFDAYLQHGYYPYFLEYDDRDLFLMTLEQNLHTTIEADLSAVHPQLTGQSIAKIKRLLSFVAASVPYTPDITTLKKVVEVSDNRTLKTYLKYLEDAGVIMQLPKGKREYDSLRKPEKIYLNNPNQVQALCKPAGHNIGNLRETFFCNQVRTHHKVHAVKRGDFIVDGKWTFEVGGKHKTRKQIKGLSNAWLAMDDIELGSDNKIPLWLFGFLY
jgi:predicted AAA+ superfamily ATPase